MERPASLGRIEVITGGMFSGKTEEMINRLKRVVYAKREIQLFKPLQDDRYSDTDVVSHEGLKMKACVVKDSIELKARINPGTYTIGIDEAQFFDEGLVSLVEDLANKGRRVILSCLDKDLAGKPFLHNGQDVVPRLLCLAEQVTKLQAVCMVCGEDANFSQCTNLDVIESIQGKRGSQIIVAGKEDFEPRCRRHFTGMDIEKL
jgi:thymidine kinase